MSYLQNIELPASINQVKRFGMVNSLLWSRLKFLFGARWLLLFVGCSLLFAGCFLLFTISHTCSPYLLSRWAFYIFFSGVTQSNEDAGWVQDFTLLFLCLVQIKRIRRQGESRILSCIPSGGSFSSDLLRAVISYWAESHLESFQTPAMEYSWENNKWTCLTRGRFPQKSYTADVRLDSDCASDWRCSQCGMRVDCKCLKFVTAGWCTVK